MADMARMIHITTYHSLFWILVVRSVGMRVTGRFSLDLSPEANLELITHARLPLTKYGPNCWPNFIIILCSNTSVSSIEVHGKGVGWKWGLPSEKCFKCTQVETDSMSERS